MGATAFASTRRDLAGAGSVAEAGSASTTYNSLSAGRDASDDLADHALEYRLVFK
jgi:hypothetical protein